MSDLLPEILRKHGVSVNDGDDIKVLDELFMEQVRVFSFFVKLCNYCSSEDFYGRLLTHWYFHIM